MAADLRPLTTIEILDAAWLVLRRNWAQLYACSGIGTAPIALLVIGYFIWLGTLVEGTEDAVFYTGTAVWGAAMAAAWTLNSVARAAVTAIALGDARGAPVGFGQAWRMALKEGPGSAFVALVSF